MADNMASIGEQIERLTKASAAPIVGNLGDVPVTLEGGKVVRREDLLHRPLLRREIVTLTTVDSFINYVNDHASENSAIFSDRNSLRFGAIFDYEDGQGVLNQRHLAKHTLELTTAFAVWEASEDEVMSQEEFALFLEANAGDIVEPEAAHILQVATELRAIKDVQFDAKVKLENGSHVFSYKEEVKGTFQNGNTEVPKSFYIGVPIFRGQPDSYKLECKLRYRVSKEGGLVLWYSIPLLERAKETAYEDVCKQVKNGVTVEDVKQYEATVSF